LEHTPFDGLVSWIAQLRESYGIRVDSAVIEPGSAAGTVNATLVLHAR
jgi:type II secretory pathway component PulM